jgi:hypothetical protein
MKNVKTILGFIAFVSTFIFSAGLVQLLFPSPDVSLTPKSQYKTTLASDIESFIRQDIRHGQKRDKRFYQRSGGENYLYSADYADAVMEYWKTSSGMNARQFPQDFQTAWRLHMNAWGDYAKFLAKHKNSSDRKRMTEEFWQMEKSYTTEINQTWEELLQIGRSYGADVW